VADRLSRLSSFDVVNVLFMIAFLIVTLLPFMNVIAKSFSTEQAIISGKVSLFPVGFHVKSYEFVLTGPSFLRALFIQVVVTATGIGISLFLTVCISYPLSLDYLPGKRFLLIMVVFTMMFHVGIIPTFLLVRGIGIYNTLWALILPLAFNGYYVLIVRSFMLSLPVSLIESAKIEGAHHGRILWSIIVPLSVPVIASITVFVGVQYWNDYFHALMFITSSQIKPLQLYLREIVLENTELLMNERDITQEMEQKMRASPESIRAATIFASTLPILFVYPFLQRFFVKGIMIGAVKG
jgi:putative aldouronate transport system permease protein